MSILNRAQKNTLQNQEYLPLRAKAVILLIRYVCRYAHMQKKVRRFFVKVVPWSDAFVYSFFLKVFLLPQYADMHYKMTIFYLCIRDFNL